MSVGLIALLDDIAALAKVAAASLDDIGAQAMKAGAKAAGVVIDDAAVTPRYVVGFAAARELPIVGRIAWGSVKNKLLFLLPGALALSLLAPWAITPLLMLGGAYLCFEGAEKVIEVIFPHHTMTVSKSPGLAEDDRTLDDQKVASPSRPISSSRPRSWPSPWRRCRRPPSSARRRCSPWSASASPSSSMVPSR